MDPYSAMFMAAASAAQAPPAGPSEAKSSGTIGNNYDHSGFNVTFGNNSGVTTKRTQTTDAPMQKYLPYVIVGVAGLLAWRYLKNKK